MSFSNLAGSALPRGPGIQEDGFPENSINRHQSPSRRECGAAEKGPVCVGRATWPGPGPVRRAALFYQTRQPVGIGKWRTPETPERAPSIQPASASRSPVVFAFRAPVARKGQDHGRKVERQECERSPREPIGPGGVPSSACLPRFQVRAAESEFSSEKPSVPPKDRLSAPDSLSAGRSRPAQPGFPPVSRHSEKNRQSAMRQERAMPGMLLVWGNEPT
jgi:hypothetical protein